MKCLMTRHQILYETVMIGAVSKRYVTSWLRVLPSFLLLQGASSSRRGSLDWLCADGAQERTPGVAIFKRACIIAKSYY